MNCRRLFPRPSCFFLVCMVAMSAGFSRAQDLICHAQPDTIDALLELNRQAPYEDGAVLPALQLALHAAAVEVQHGLRGAGLIAALHAELGGGLCGPVSGVLAGGLQAEGVGAFNQDLGHGTEQSGKGQNGGS